MRNRTYRVVLWTLALLGVAADQASKYSVFSWLAPAGDNQSQGGAGKEHWVFQAGPNAGFRLRTQFQTDGKGYFLRDNRGDYMPHVNQGALFGIFGDQGGLANRVFAVISLAAAAAILYWSTRKAATRSLWVCIALGLILAGTLGNLYDRVVFNGVRDFLWWNYLFDWPVFNVADSFLVVGAGLLLMQAFGRPAVAAAEATPSGGTTEAVAAPEPVLHKRAI